AAPDIANMPALDEPATGLGYDVEAAPVHQAEEDVVLVWRWRQVVRDDAGYGGIGRRRRQRDATRGRGLTEPDPLAVERRFHPVVAAQHDSVAAKCLANVVDDDTIRRSARRHDRDRAIGAGAMVLDRLMHGLDRALDSLVVRDLRGGVAVVERVTPQL